LKDLQEDPDRLRRPVRRTATGFEAIVWDEAYALAASRWKDVISLDQVLESASREPGPERILDVLLRLGPYGDGLGIDAEELGLAGVQQHEHGIDLGPLVPMLPAVSNRGALRCCGRASARSGYPWRSRPR
jgi:anaerobic selenocysteine-containing dehydrogenase